MQRRADAVFSRAVSGGCRQTVHRRENGSHTRATRTSDAQIQDNAPPRDRATATGGTVLRAFHA